MLKSSKRIVFALLLIALLTVFSTGVMAQDADARLRFMHAIPGVSAVDIYTDGQLTVTDLDYSEATGYIYVPAGAHSLTVTATGTTTPLWEQQVNADADIAKTLIASSINPLEFKVYTEDSNTLDFGSLRLLLVHAVENGPAVDVALSDGSVIAPGVNYGDPYGPFDLPTQVYNFAVVPAGGSIDSAIIPATPFAFNANTLYVLVVYGTANAPETALLSSAAPASSDSGFVRFVHGVVGGPAVDVYAGDTLVAASLYVDRPTDHIPLPIGDYEIAFNEAGTATALATTSISVAAGEATTVYASGTAGDVSLSSVADDIASVAPDVAVISITNSIPESESISVALADGTELASEVAFGETSSSVVLDPTKQDVTFTITLGETRGNIEVPRQTFYGGVYYNAVALPGSAFSPPMLVFSPTSLSQGIASAPGSATISAGSTGATADAFTTPEPTEIAVQPTTDTSTEVVTPQPTQAPVVTSPEVEGPTAVVRLNPGVNLQLRQYPNAQAKSLGLVPTGSTLVVNGRVGPAVYGENETPPEDEPEFVDPALALQDEDEDLVPEETWLNVTWTTPDGGSITAWVNALYLEVRDDRGDLQRLADLPYVAQNLPGSVSNTEITPPPPPENQVLAVVTNLNPGVNLNIRRTPETAGEVLDRIPNGTVTQFIGLSEDGDWVFIDYRPTDGGSITGWVGALYIRFEYRGAAIDLEEMEQRELLEYVDTDRRGEIAAGTALSTAPTPDPLKDTIVALVQLNEGTNLHLRVQPDATTESLDLIPTGTQVVVTARTADSEWLQVEFEGTTGWISSAYVVLTFNGQPYDLETVPVAETE